MVSLRYRLDDLGWEKFEALSQSLLSRVFAVGMQHWGGPGDWGRDAYYEGALPIPDPTYAGSPRRYVFQAKFVESANAAGAKPGPALTGAVHKEVPRFSGRPGCDCYVLITNVVLSADLRTSIEEILAAALPKTQVVTWGGKELSGFLDHNDGLRLRFPQLMSIGDINELIAQVVHKPAHERSAAMLERATEDARVFVPTAAHRAALATLNKHHMAVLSGLPEMGKTTIAYAIAWELALDEWKAYAVRGAEELLGLYKRDDRQLFVADDAFGTTEYRPGLAEEWAASLDSVLRKLGPNHWVIWTTRTAPLEQALHVMHLQGLAEHFPEPGRVIVHASTLTQREKALMLYAHAKAAELSTEQRMLVRKMAVSVIEHPHLTPKRIQRFVRETLPGLNAGADLELAVAQELRSPTDSMRKSFNALPAAHKKYLIAALDGPDAEAAYARHARGESLSREVVESSLGEHFIVHRKKTARAYAGVPLVDWAHPSWRDLVIDYVAESSDRRAGFIANCDLQGLGLALSAGGGKEGERRLPFLQSESDWAALGARLPSLLKQLDGFRVRELLALAKSIFDPEFARNANEATHLASLVPQILHAARDFWNDQEEPAELWPLTTFYELGERVTPFIGGPDLRITWKLWLEEARTELEEPDFYTSFPSVDLWLDGCDLLQRNEPRFLRHVGFPASVRALADRAIEVCREYVDGDPSPDYLDEYEAEIDQLQAIEQMCRRLEKHVPDVAEAARETHGDARYRIRRYEEKIAYGVPPRPPKSGSPGPAVEPRQTEVSIDVARLFSDL